MPPTDRATLTPGLAASLTFVAAATVLVLEIAAGRLLAPYVGVSLTTYTGIIGVILAGIALGAWAGGRAADDYGPLTLLGPTLVTGGLAAIASVPIVDVVGSLDLGSGIGAIVVLAALGFVAPAATLSAVAPMIVRATITDIETSGSLVGRLSAVGTVGAISGTFLTGFVLLGALPTRVIIFGAGGLVVLTGVAVTWWAAQRGRRDGGGSGSAAGIGGKLLGTLIGFVAVTGVGLAAPRPCERESAYYCIAVVEDPVRSGGRTLVLDRLRHAYVDLADPSHLQFGYIRLFDAALADPIAARGGDVDVLHVGGGGFSFPRFLAAAHPASRHTVLELDPVVLDVARTELGFAPASGVSVIVGDARLSAAELVDDSYDAIVGDAFGGLSVPWHLTTAEFLGELDRLLGPGGRYVMNLIDGEGLRFVRAEAGTLAARFEHVAVLAPPSSYAGGGNVVLVASHEPIDADAIEQRVVGGGDQVRIVTGDDELAAFVAGATVLTDDFAPVDQLIGR